MEKTDIRTVSGHKVILIPDNLKVHHRKPVREWLSKNTDKIEVFYTGIEGTSIYCRERFECKTDGAQKPEIFRRVLTLRTFDPGFFFNSPGLQPGDA